MDLAVDIPPDPPNPRPSRKRNSRRPPRSDAAAAQPRSSPFGSQPQPQRIPSTTTPGQPRASRPRGGRRGAKFNSGLTAVDPDTDVPNRTAKPSASTHRPSKPEADDLTSRLIHALRTPPYPDCPICFSAIHPAQRTWSCSPSIPIVPSESDADDNARSKAPEYCWTTFHMKCIVSWASKSVSSIKEAWAARGDPTHLGEWRCPGCQGRRVPVPRAYACFCGAMDEPKPPRLATPHSCGGSCVRERPGGCGHPCSRECHPGPCPPCVVVTRLECWCPRREVKAFKCGVAGRDLSCGNTCGRTLACGNHKCDEVCHSGECGPCDVREEVRCLCGKERKEVGCGEGLGMRCVGRAEGEEWEGRYECKQTCELTYDCGIHKCNEPCHPPHPAGPCPLSPALVRSCPCGAVPILPLAAPSSSTTITTDLTPFPPRTSCASPLPTCGASCSKPLPNCTHACATPCHSGACPPCNAQVVRPCRCGGTTRGVVCSSLTGGAQAEELLCDKPCTALRACGRHRCHRVCCPLAALGAGRKGKKRPGAREDSAPGIGEERGGLHECDLVCDKMLGCGIHRCEERDHKGACAPCLRSSFEEMVCPCGRTVYEPPIPCGTRMWCSYPCPRPRACGHSGTQHDCHDEGSLCSPCVFLVDKLCACGKKTMTNVRCSLERQKVSCGAICGKLMECGFHHCERPCHGDDCGPCTAPCGKSRKLCLPLHHPCMLPCHAPSSCPEDAPCTGLTVLACPCGRLRQSVLCARSSSAPMGRTRSGSSAGLECNKDCAVAKRNARLADALRITQESREKTLMQRETARYHDDLGAFARANAKFLSVVERAFEEFVNSEKKTQVLPHMPPERRKFVHDLAAIYRMDTQMVDEEPYRSVRLLRRLDTRIPSPLLSGNIASAPAPTPPNLGKLADLRSAAPSWRSPAPVSKFGPGGSFTNVNTAPRPTSAAAVAGSGSRPQPVLALSQSRLTTSASVSSVQVPPSVSGAILAQVETPAVPDSWEDDV